MKPRFRNANVLLIRVFDLCVKLLTVLHISNAQGRSVDLSVTIATGRSRTIDLISTPGCLAVVRYGAWYNNNAIVALDDGSCCMIYPAGTKHDSTDSPKAGWKVVYVECTSILHAPRWCILPRIKVGKVACSSFQTSPHHVLRSPPMPSQRSGRAPGREDKDPTRWILIWSPRDWT